MEQSIYRSNKNLRILRAEDIYSEEDFRGETFCVISYVVQIKVFFFWINIKEYNYINEATKNHEDIEKLEIYNRNCAEDLYEHILKNE